MRDDDDGLATVMDDQPISSRLGPVVNKAVGAVITVRVLLARGVHVCRHHLAAMLAHRASVAVVANVCNGSKGDIPTLTSELI